MYIYRLNSSINSGKQYTYSNIYVFLLVPIIEQVPICIIHQVTLDNATWVSLGLTVMLQQRYKMPKLPH